MKPILLIFLGGGIGSVLRYAVSKLYEPYQGAIPIGTFTVNILGSLLIGLLLGYSLKTANLSQNTLFFLVAGVCGGFTTFSTFSYENYSLLKAGDYLNFGIYTSASLILGILCVFLGIWIAKLI